MGDKETGRRGDKEITVSPCLLVTLSVPLWFAYSIS